MSDSYRGKGKSALKNSFFITNALYQNEHFANIDEKYIQQDLQNSYFAVSDRNDKDEQTKFNVSQTKNLSNMSIQQRDTTKQG